MRQSIKGIFVLLFCILFISPCFSAERMPRRIEYFGNSPEGKVKITYALKRLDQKEMDDIEKAVLSFLKDDKGHKATKVELARYASRNCIMGWQVTPDLAPVDVIRVDYENDPFARDIRRKLREEVSQNAKIRELNKQELSGRNKEFHGYDIEFLCYDAIGYAKGAGELALLVKGNSLIIFYYRYSWIEPVRLLAEQIRGT